MNDRVTIVGAGLAGCESAWQLVRRGVPVRLIDMKPVKFSPAHKSEGFAELVCSNSLKAEQMSNASGLLKAEMRLLDGLILSAAERSRVPAGGALAVDRDVFSRIITDTLKNHPLVEFESKLVDEIPEAPAIIATGPLTDPALTDAIARLSGAQTLHFFDAAAPIVTADSLDMDKVFRASRYDRGSDYLNCPMTEAEYNAFYDALMGAELAELHDFEKKLVFEGCLAVEILASRGRMTLAFGPLKPVGLIDPRTGREPFAVVQLRQENESGTMYNLVGFQTRLKWGESRLGTRRIRALRRNAPQYILKRSRAAGRELRAEEQSPDPLRRSAFRRGGLYGIHLQRHGGGDRPVLRHERQTRTGFHRQNHHRRAGAPCFHPQREFPADERQLRRAGAAERAHPRQEIPL